MSKIGIGQEINGYRVLESVHSEKPGRHWLCECISCKQSRIISTSVLNAARAKCRCASSFPQMDRQPIMLEIDGLRRSLTEWTRETGTSHNTMRWRLKQRRRGYYLTDREVIYGHHLNTMDPVRGWHDPLRRRAEMDQWMERIVELVAEPLKVIVAAQIEEKVRNAVEEVLHPVIRTLLVKAAESNFSEVPAPDTVIVAAPESKEDMDPLAHMTSEQRAEAEARIPPHPRDDELLNLLGMTVRQFRLENSHCSPEDLEMATNDVLSLHDKSDVTALSLRACYGRDHVSRAPSHPASNA